MTGRVPKKRSYTRRPEASLLEGVCESRKPTRDRSADSRNQPSGGLLDASELRAAPELGLQEIEELYAERERLLSELEKDC
jgi:hypothetical protein